ncbi:MAG: tetratricopeptide repeat protein [Planctomycetes bacterium]|nr:tetratricopeptide repeat protein [Planctomycetota bacterium]
MRTTGACLLLCLLGSVLSAQPADNQRTEWESSLTDLYLDPALKQGDLDAHAEKLIKLIEKSPGSHAALLALRQHMGLKDELSSLRPLYALLAKYATDDFKKCGSRPQEFADAYIELAKRYSVSLEWQTVARRWRGITEVAFVGPFADGSGGTHDDVFAPEVMVDFDAEYQGAHDRIRWQPVKHFDPFDATLSLYSQKRWTGYGYYVATELVSDADRSCRLTFTFNGPTKVWLNGIQMVDMDSRRGDTPDEIEIRAGLQRGRNIVLVKLATISSLEIKLRGDDGFPATGVVAMTPGVDSPRMKIGSSNTAVVAQPPEYTLAEKFAQQGRDAQSKLLEGLGYLAGADVYDHYGAEILATTAAEKALALLGENPLVQLQFLRWMDEGPLYSSSERRKLTRAMTEQLLAEDATLVPAIFAKAELLSGDERYREAVELLDGALEHTPGKWRVHLKLAEVFRDANWRMEREGAIKDALKIAPDSLPVLRAASDYFASIGAQAREIAMDRQRLKLMPGDPDAHLSLANTLARTADIEGSLKHLRILIANDPASEFLQDRLAEALAANGNLTDALAVVETMAEQSPRPEAALYKGARACLQLGREELGVEYLDRVVKLSPGHHAARRQLQRIRGESEDFWSEYSVAWEELIEHDLTREQFPRADSAVILDEQIQYMYPDGSSISYVRQVRKILTQEGVDARGKERVSGELVIARTIQADGTVLEPITQSGGLIEFPGVKIGAYLDVAYLVRAGGGPLQTLDGDTFYFVDQKLDEPFAISRWVLVAPKTAPISPIYHNMRPDDEGVTITTESTGERVVYTWDVRNPQLPEREAFMPSPVELVPWIECVNPRDWRDRARKVADEGLRGVMDTSLIRERALSLTEGLEADEDRARAIYDWVNATFTTEGDAWNAHQALKSGAGDRQELFISLCAASGVRLAFACVDATPPYKAAPEESMPRPHWGYPNRSDFEDFYVVVRASSGEDIFVSMIDRLRPFGDIPARRHNAPAIIWRDGADGHASDYELGFLPGGSREKDRFENKVTITLGADGSATLEGSITVHGERSYDLKESMRTTPNDELCSELEATLASQYQGFEVSECIFPRIGEVGQPLVQEYTGSVRRMATPGDSRLTLELPGEKLGRLMSILVGSRKRDSDIVLNFDLVQTDEIRIRAPEGYAFSGVPNDLVYPTAPLTYELKFRVEDDELVVTRKLVLGPGRFRPEEYSDLVEQIKRIKQAEDSTLTLVKS